MKNSIKFFLTLFFCLLLTTYYLSPVRANESTPSSETSIKSKLEALKAEIASKAAKYKQEVSQKLQNKAYVGTVKTISEQTLMLDSPAGLKTVNINQDTIYESSLSKKYSFRNIEKNDLIAALGDIDDTNVLTAKKIVDLPTQTKTSKTIIWGQVLELSSKIIIKTKDNKKLTIVVDSNTTYQKSDKEITFENIRLNDIIIIVGIVDKSENLSAKFIYVTPQGVVIKPKAIATSSSQVATPAAKKK